jgi:hypothetical protein
VNAQPATQFLLPDPLDQCGLPAPVRNSPLLRCHQGFAILEGIPGVDNCVALLREAERTAASAERTEVDVSDREDVRGGSPARRFWSAVGGHVLQAYYQSPWMARLIRELCGSSVTPSGRQGTYTYYAAPGDHLAIHRDVRTCDVAVITCLSDSGSRGDGGMMCLYPQRCTEPLSVIRCSPARGARALRLIPGQTIIMLGGIVPHAIQPVLPGQARVVSVLCYQLQT